MPTIRALLAQAHIADCEASCGQCAIGLADDAVEDEEELQILPIAAE